MKPLLSQLSSSLKNENYGVRRREWARYIIGHNIPVKELLPLLGMERTIAMRFTWLLGDLLEEDPNVVYPCITWFYERRNDIKVQNFNRSLAKMFYLAGVPPEIEGSAMDELFKWLLDPASNVTTKSYSLQALHRLSNKHPELKNELKIVIEDQLNKNTASFDKRAGKVLEALQI